MIREMATTITKDNTMRVTPTTFGFDRKTGFSVRRTGPNRYSIGAGNGDRRVQSDGRLEFSVAKDIKAYGQPWPATVSWRKRGDSVSLTIKVT